MKCSKFIVTGKEGTYKNKICGKKAEFIFEGMSLCREHLEEIQFCWFRKRLV